MVEITGEYDFSQPISTILRAGTSDAPSAAEYSQGAGWLTRGEPNKDEYVRFLMMLWHIYDTLERALERHASHPVLEPTYNPTLLARAPNLASDIAFFLQCQETTWQAHPAHTALLLSRPKPFIEFTTHLQALSDSADPSLLLAHAYVRYLGDLSGGQVMRYRVAKAYDIGVDSGEGIRFYDFEDLERTRSGTIEDFKKIKEWFRAGMDSGVGDNEKLKAALLEEANRAYELNLDLFSTLNPPKLPTPTDDSAVILLGDAESDIDDGESETKDIPTEIVRGDGQRQERMVSLGSVFSVVVAVCLAHFLLVTTGLTGTAWIEKLKSTGFSVL